MPNDTNRRFQAAFNQLSPQARDAFIEAVNDIATLADLDAIESALEAGNIELALELLDIDERHYKPLKSAIAAIFEGGGIYQVESLPFKDPGTNKKLIFRFDGRHERAERWIREMAGERIVEITQEQRLAARRFIEDSMRDGTGPKKLALDLMGRVNRTTGRREGGLIGLTDREIEFVDNHRLRLIEKGTDAREIERLMKIYTNKLLRVRGERIARTETIRALNAGRMEATQQMIDDGLVDLESVYKVWNATGDLRVRHSHRALDTDRVRFDEPFYSAATASQLMYPGDTSLGAPASETINCRCWMEIDIDFLAGVT